MDLHRLRLRIVQREFLHFGSGFYKHLPLSNSCVKNLPTFLQPVAEGIKALTGLMTIVHVVGPMGALAGEIGVMRLANCFCEDEQCTDLFC